MPAEPLASDDRPQQVQLLRIARWCGVAPAVLGTGALAGWLISGGVIAEVGLFYGAGMLAVLIGLLLLPLAMWFLFRAWRHKAPWRQLLITVAILTSNLPLAALCWYIASSLTALQIMRVVNESDQPTGPIDVWLQPSRQPRHRLRIPRLQPGSSIVRGCLYRGEGVAEFRAEHGSRTLTSTRDNAVFLGIGQPMEARLTLSNRGQHSFVGIHNPRWAWLDALWAELWQANTNESMPLP